MSESYMKLIMMFALLFTATVALADPNDPTEPLLVSINFDDGDASGGGILSAFGDIGNAGLRTPNNDDPFDPGLGHTDAELYVDGANNHKINFNMGDVWQMSCSIRSHRPDIRSISIQVVAGSEVWEQMTGELLVIAGGTHFGGASQDTMGWYIVGTHGWNAVGNGVDLGTFGFLEEIQFKFIVVHGLFTIQKKIVGVDADFVTVLSDADASTRLGNGFIAFNAQDGGSYLLDDIVITGTGTPIIPACGDALHPFPDKDLNGDCIVDAADLDAFIQSWLIDTNP